MYMCNTCILSITYISHVYIYIILLIKKLKKMPFHSCIVKLVATCVPNSSSAVCGGEWTYIRNTANNVRCSLRLSVRSMYY